jgi:nucleoside-diphosphate-sugar epimerase
MRVLIIGCGYVGLPLALELARQRHEVFGLGRSATANVALLAGGVTPLQADITLPQTLAGLPRRYDWVVNCTASGGGDAASYQQLYLQGTKNLIDWLATAPPKKFIYTSSTAVYGQDDGSEVTETSPTEPAAATARVLVETEKLLIEAARLRQFPAMVLRVAGIYGPERGYLLKQFLSGEARIENKGARIMNMIHRDDLIGVIIAALQNGTPGEIYNAVDDEPVSQLAFFQWLAATLGKPVPPSALANTAVRRKRGLTSKKVSNHKLKTEVGCAFKFPDFRTGYGAEIERLKEAGALEI